MKVLRYERGGEENCGEQLKADGLHLPGVSAHMSETLCGACDSMAPFERVEAESPTCKNCISVAKELFGKYSKKQVSAW